MDFKPLMCQQKECPDNVWTFLECPNINYGMVAAIITIYHLEVSNIEVLQCPHLYSRLSC